MNGNEQEKERKGKKLLKQASSAYNALIVHTEIVKFDSWINNIIAIVDREK